MFTRSNRSVGEKEAARTRRDLRSKCAAGERGTLGKGRGDGGKRSFPRASQKLEPRTDNFSQKNCLVSRHFMSRSAIIELAT